MLERGLSPCALALRQPAALVFTSWGAVPARCVTGSAGTARRPIVCKGLDFPLRQGRTPLSIEGRGRPRSSGGNGEGGPGWGPGRVGPKSQTARGPLLSGELVLAWTLSSRAFYRPKGPARSVGWGRPGLLCPLAVTDSIGTCAQPVGAGHADLCGNSERATAFRDQQ